MRSGGRRALALICALTAMMVSGWLVAAVPQVPPELAKVREEIRELEGRLQNLEKKHHDLGAQREQLETQLTLAVMRVKEAEGETAVAERAVALAAAAATQARQAVTRAIERLRLQVSLLAVLGRAGWAPLVLHALGSAQDVPERITLALALVREDKRRRDETEKLLDQRTAALAVLSRRREELASASRQLVERQSELVTTRRSVVAQLQMLENEQRTGAVALASANEAAERLEHLWGVLAGSGSQLGSDIKLLRGGLRWPLGSPRLLQGYGLRRDPQYGTVTISNGIEIGGSPGENVCSVAPGRVVFAQFFKGYGNLVIVDHGSEVYSLYARLASILVRAAQRVGIGEVVGLVGRDGDGTGKVYLEMRVGKAAQDPMSWLRPHARE